MDLNNLITAGALAALGIGLLTLGTAIKPPEKEERAGEGERIVYPPEEKEEKEKGGEKIPPVEERDDDRTSDRDVEREIPFKDPCSEGTKPLGCPCKDTGQCSATGMQGGRSATIFDRVTCDQGRCQYDRQDWAKNWSRPSVCVGKLFGSPGTCEQSYEEREIRNRLGW